MGSYFRKTKIICTLGPASSSKLKIRRLAEAGMDIARLNFSHGSWGFHEKIFKTIRRVSKEINRPIGIMQDLEGHRIRTGELENHEPINLKRGQTVSIASKKRKGKKGLITFSYDNFEKFLKEGYSIYIDDGKIKLKVTKVGKNEVEARVISGGELKERKGVNVPEADFKFTGLSGKDKEDLEFGLKLGVDYVAQSFIRCSEDIKNLKRFMKRKKRVIPILAKIENSEGIKNIAEITEASEAIVVARGDMGVCLSLERVPIIQKQIINQCNRAGKPVVTATQMLDSMTTSKQPTRAEVADVANAIIDGTDLVMLSAETAVGEYPREAVSYMNRIAVNTEKSLDYDKILSIRDIRPSKKMHEAMSFGLRNLAQLMDIEAIIVYTQTLEAVKVVAKFRPGDLIIAATDNREVIHEALLYWGVCPVYVKDMMSKDADHILDILLKRRIISKGNLVVFTEGIKPEGIKFGSIDILKV
jgi:pyruvate kinase